MPSVFTIRWQNFFIVYDFDLEQFYTLQLIKTGNFAKARNSIDNLMARVMVLINREKEYRRDIIREPQNIFFDRSIRGKKSEDEIKEQFEEEEKVFANMFSWRNRYDALPEDKKQEAEMMFENLEWHGGNKWLNKKEV